MATQTYTVLVDDLDGTESPDAETVLFGFGGVQYEIDLAPKNLDKLSKAITPYVASARRVGGRKSGQGKKHAVSSVDAPRRTALIREWAKENGLAVSERGRISADITQQYEAANS